MMKEPRPPIVMTAKELWAARVVCAALATVALLALCGSLCT